LPGQTGAITGPLTPCQSSSGNIYTIQPVANASGYLWTVPAGWTIVSGQNTIAISATAGTNPGDITATAINVCGSSNTAVLPVSITLPPVANAGNDQTIGFGSSASLSGSASGGGGVYTWHWEPASLLIDPNVQNPVTVNLTSSVQFILTVTDAVSGCTDDDEMIVYVTGGPLTLFVTADPNPVCEGNPVQLLALASGGTGAYAYSWSSNPPGFSSNIPNPSVIPTGTTTYIAQVNDGFTTLTDSVTVILLPLPETPEIPSGPDTIDLNFITSSFYTIPHATGAQTYFWEIDPLNAGTLLPNDTICEVIWNQTYLGDAWIRVKAINSCGESGWSPGKVTFIDNTTTVSEAKRLIPVIFPNPGTGVFFIRNGSVETCIYDLSVRNGSGHLVFYRDDISFDGNSTVEIRLNNTTPGIYLLTLTNGQEQLHYRIVILK
jgi:hypothetical protein